MLPGSHLNPGGRNQHNGRACRLALRARALLDEPRTTGELAKLGLPSAAQSLLPEEPSLADALVAALIVDALQGDHHARRDLLSRAWPAVKPVELGVQVGPLTFAELMMRAQDLTMDADWKEQPEAASTSASDNVSCRG